MIILFIAPPAAGKGTQAKLICDKYHLEHLSTGNLLRELAVSDEKIKQKLKEGKFIDDNIVISLLKEKLNDESNVVLDGFPRNLNQAQKFDQILFDINKKIDYIFYLDLDLETAKNRILRRTICLSCNSVYPNGEQYCKCGNKLIHREDDNIETFLKRYKIYEIETKPVLEYYSKQKHFYQMDGSLSTEKIFQNIINIIGEK